MTCSVEGCDRVAFAKGWCNMHYHRVKRLGAPGPVGPLTNKHLPAEERFWRAFDQDTESGCWVWRGIAEGRYALLRVDGVQTVAHRFAYELLVGPISDGLVIDHLCRNTRCVNPGHLEPVTDSVNVLRGEGPLAINARKTHCVGGHPLDGPTASLKPNKNGYRVCKECARLQRKERAAKTGKW